MEMHSCKRATDSARAVLCLLIVLIGICGALGRKTALDLSALPCVLS